MGDVAERITQMAESEDSDYEFAADSPTAVVRQVSGGGNPRPQQPPAQEIENYRLIADTDPHVGEAVDTLVDYLVGSGFTIQPANIPGTDTEQTDQDIAELKRMVEMSDFDRVLSNWVWHALVDGTGLLEIVVEDGYFRPKVLPTEDIEIQTDEFGNIIAFNQLAPSGDEIEFEKHEIAVLRFHRHPDEDFGRSIIERVQEQADILRDMEIDTARFVATKAYPPILWQCGSEERPWTQQQIDDWLNEIDSIEPESMLAVGHDVEQEVVGVTATSSSAGAMRLEETFVHLMQRIATGLGVPADLLNTETLSGNALQTTMTKFDRRIQRYRSIITNAIRYQIFPSILADSTAREYAQLPPDFEFGKHSSEEERLDADLAIRLVNNGLLSREAAAKRMGIDPEVELPNGSALQEHIALIQQLQGAGDNIQNPDGGRPTDTGGGTQSAGREATTRENPNDDSSDQQDRPQQSPEGSSQET
jgi:hypothetical protein